MGPSSMHKKHQKIMSPKYYIYMCVCVSKKYLYIYVYKTHHLMLDITALLPARYMYKYE